MRLRLIGRVLRWLVVVYAALCTVCFTAVLGLIAREEWRRAHRPVYVFPAEADRGRLPEGVPP